MLEHGADGETFAAAEVPKSAGAWFGINDYWAANRSYGSGIEVEGDIEFLTGRDCRGNVVLAKEV